MNAILGFSQLLCMNKETSLNQLQKNNVNEITKAGKHLLTLINEILDLSKIESGNFELLMESVSLSAVLRDSLQLMTPLAEKRGITIHLHRKDVSITSEQLPFY